MLKSSDRIILESPQEMRISSLIEPIARSLGYELVRVKISSLSGMTVQIMAQRPDGQFTVEDCEQLNDAVSAVMDAEANIDVHYNLEVSSPGIDRPLVRIQDFHESLGCEVRVELTHMVDGRRRIRGEVVKVGDDGFAVDLDRAGSGSAARFKRISQKKAEGKPSPSKKVASGEKVTQAEEEQQTVVNIRFEDVAAAKLVLTDALIERTKKAQQEADAKDASEDIL